MKLSNEELQDFLEDIEVVKDLIKRHENKDFAEARLLAATLKVYISVIVTGNIDTISKFANHILNIVTTMEDELAEGHKDIIVIPTPDIKQ